MKLPMPVHYESYSCAVSHQGSLASVTSVPDFANLPIPGAIEEDDMLESPEQQQQYGARTAAGSRQKQGKSAGGTEAGKPSLGRGLRQRSVSCEPRGLRRNSSVSISAVLMPRLSVSVCVHAQAVRWYVFGSIKSNISLVALGALGPHGLHCSSSVNILLRLHVLGADKPHLHKNADICMHAQVRCNNVCACSGC